MSMVTLTHELGYRNGASIPSIPNTGATSSLSLTHYSLQSEHRGYKLSLTHYSLQNISLMVTSPLERTGRSRAHCGFRSRGQVVLVRFSTLSTGCLALVMVRELKGFNCATTECLSLWLIDFQESVIPHRDNGQ